MDLTKRKDFTLKQEGSTFSKRRKTKKINNELFPAKFDCFFVSLSNAGKIQLWLKFRFSSTMQQSDIFLKPSKHFQGNLCDGDHLR